MSYVVKVGEYYVKNVNDMWKDTLGDITLSKEIMRTFPKSIVDKLAKQLNGTVVEFKEQVTTDEYEQLSLFDNE